MSDARARLHFLGIFFRRSDQRFERLRETNRGGSAARLNPPGNRR